MGTYQKIFIFSQGESSHVVELDNGLKFVLMPAPQLPVDKKSSDILAIAAFWESVKLNKPSTIVMLCDFAEIGEPISAWQQPTPACPLDNLHPPVCLHGDPLLSACLQDGLHRAVVLPACLSSHPPFLIHLFFRSLYWS